VGVRELCKEQRNEGQDGNNQGEPDAAQNVDYAENLQGL
jgi:hypothetical protein